MCAYGECGVQDMVEVDREKVKEAIPPSGGDSITGVVSVCPGVGSLGQAPVGHLIQHSLQERVRVLCVRERERESVCVCVCERERERERERDCVPCRGSSRCP